MLHYNATQPLPGVSTTPAPSSVSVVTVLVNIKLEVMIPALI